MERSSIRKCAILAAAALAIGSPAALAGGLKLGIGINIGGPAPAPTPVVVDFDTYHTGYHAALYDADWRLRNAQTEQWNAQDALDAARHHEGDIALDIDDREAAIAQAEKVLAMGQPDPALIARAEDAAADARARRDAYERRVDAARADRDAARTLHDRRGVEDAEARISTNEAGAAGADADLHAAEARLADLRAGGGASPEQRADARARIDEAQGRLPRLRDDLAIAHDEVYSGRLRLDRAVAEVAAALHDRDEALWMLHRREILAGRCEFGDCGFHVDMAVWGGRMPRDEERVHEYYVHPASYWIDRPEEIQVRVIEVDHIGEISRARDFQERHEGPRVREVEVIERRVPVEQRREYAQHVTVERQRFEAEKTERAAAASEHRAVRVNVEERAEAKAMVAKTHEEKRVADEHARTAAHEEVKDQKEQKLDSKTAPKSEKADTESHTSRSSAPVQEGGRQGVGDYKSSQSGKGSSTNNNSNNSHSRSNNGSSQQDPSH